MGLELLTAVGALLGAYIAPFIATSQLAVVFGTVLLVTVYLTLEGTMRATATMVNEHRRGLTDYA